MLSFSKSLWDLSKRGSGLLGQSRNDFSGRAATLYQVLRQPHAPKSSTWQRWMERVGLRVPRP